MVYNRVNWKTGDVMTKEKMNRSEAQLSILTASDEIFKEAMMTFRPYESSDLGTGLTLAWGNGDMSNVDGRSFNQDTTCIIQTVWSVDTFPKFIKIADGYKVKIGMRSGSSAATFEGILQSDGTLAIGSSDTDPAVDYYHTGIVSLAHINATNTWDIRFVIKNINDDTAITPAEGINLLVGEPVDVIGNFNKLDTATFTETASNNDIIWTQGYIDSSSGNESTGETYYAKRIKTNKFNKKNILSVKPARGYRIEIAAYNGATYLGKWNGTSFVKTAQFSNTEILMTDLPDNYLYRIILDSAANIDTTYYTNCIFSYLNFAPMSEINVYDCKNLFISGYYSTSGTTIGSYATHASFVTCILHVAPGEKLYVTGIGATNARVWAFADKDKKITRVAGSNAFAYNTVLTVETGEEFFIYNTDTASTVYPPYLFIETDRVKNLDALRANVSDLYTLLGCEEILYNFEGYYSTKDIGGSPIDFITDLNSDAAWQGAIVECQSGDIFTINAYGGATARAWAFLDSSKIVIANELDGSIKIENEVITAPENSAYLIIQNRKTGSADAKSYKGRVANEQLKNIDQLNSLKIVYNFDFGEWRNGWIRINATDPDGTIGSAGKHLIAGYDGSSISLKGDGNTWKISVKNDWMVANIGEYNNHTVASFSRFLDLSTNEVTLLSDKFYCFDIKRISDVQITPANIADNTITLTRTYYTDKTLTLSDKAADAKIVGDTIEALKDTKADSFLDIEFNNTNKRIARGHSTYSDGTIITASGFYVTNYIDCTEGMKVSFYGYDFYYNGSYASYVIAFYDANRTFISGVYHIGESTGTVSRIGMAEATAPANTAYVVFCTGGSADSSYAHVYSVIPDNIALKSDLDEIYSNKAWDIGSYNLLDKSTATFGIMTKSGTITPSSGWRYSDFIPVEPGMVLYAGQYSPTNFALYDSNKNLVTNDANWSNPFTVPENVHYIIMTFSQADPDIPYLSTKNAYDEYKTIATYIHGLDSSISTINANIDDINTDVQYVGLSSPYNITWELGKNINNATTGDVVASPYTALSNILPPSPIIIRTGADTDSSDIALSMFVYEFDSNNVGLGRTKLSETDGKVMRTSPNCAYIRIVFGRPQSTGVSITQSDIDNYFGVDVLTSMREVADEVKKHRGIYDEKLKYVALGSSTTEGTYSQINIRSSVGVTQYGFPYWIAKENNYELANLGHGGGGWLNHGNRDNNNVLSLIDNILKAQTFDDSATYSLGQCSIQNGDIYRYAKNINGTSVWTPLSLGPIVNSTEEAFSNKNIITISYGTNDFKAQWKNSDTNVQQWYLGSINQRWRNPNDARIVTLGDSTYGYTSDLDSKLTVIGAMSIALENLAVLAPNAQIIVILPGNFKKLGTVSSATPTSDEIEIVSETSGNITTYYAYGKEANNYGCGTHNHEGKTLADYRAAIKECAEYYGVRVVDMGICAANRINMNQLLGDGIHPTLAYYKQIGYTLAPLIR